MFFSAVRHSSADVGHSWKSYPKSRMGESRLRGFAQMSINHELLIDPEKVMDELAKKSTSELHTLTNLSLSADGFSLCMPTTIA